MEARALPPGLSQPAPDSAPLPATGRGPPSRVSDPGPRPGTGYLLHIPSCPEPGVLTVVAGPLAGLKPPR